MNDHGCIARRQGRACSATLALSAVCAVLAGAAFAQPPDPVFNPHADYGTQSNPWPVVVADLNGDGIPDLVAGNEASNSVSVLRGTGAGQFAAKVDHPAGLAPRHLALGDLNGDSFLDLAVANYLGGGVSVLFGNGAGGFNPPQTYATGGGAYGVAIGNVDGASGNDLVVVNASSNTASVLFGDGAGGFGPKVDYPTGSWPVAVSLAHVDGDAALDMVVANYISGTFWVRLGVGDGTFHPAISTPTGPNPWFMVVTDLNGDGLPEVATANAGNSTASVAINNGAGGFANSVSHPTGGAQPAAIDAGDVNVDGIKDLVIGHLAGSSVAVLPGLGSGSFGTAKLFGAGAGQHGVVVADLNADQRPDIVATLPGPDLVAVFVNTVIAPLSFSTAPNPSAPGQSVTVTAVITPNTASGAVDFFDDGTPIGTVLVQNGLAQMAYSGFGTGLNIARAIYSGDITHPRDTSDVQHFVKVQSTVELVSAPNPSVTTQPLTLTATVTPSTATGSVSFYRGTLLIGAGPVTGGVATATLDSLPFGVHLLQCTYNGDPGLFASEDTLTHVVNRAHPEMVDVRDVPGDQGGRVFVSWRFIVDRPGLTHITGYRVWRRLPLGEAQGALAAGDSRRIEKFATRGGDGALAEAFWEAIADLPAAQLQSYGYTAATTRDSMAGSNPHTAFFVQALTPRQFDYYNSQPDSGYSVDNLAPAQPQPFVGVFSGSGVALHWLPNREPDLAGYRLHRGNAPNFVPDDGNLVSAQPDTGYNDPQGTYGSHYKLAAVDIHGNRSPYALVMAELPTATIASVRSVNVSAGRVAIEWQLDAQHTVSVYRRTEDGGWRQLGERTADGERRVAYADEGVAPGRYGYRVGIQRGDGETFAGEVWVDVVRFELAMRVAPNPVRALPLTVQFTLPSAGPASIRMLDVSGRLVEEMEVGGMGPGAHTLSLAPRGRLAPGIYLIRIQQGGESRIQRVAVLN